MVDLDEISNDRGLRVVGAKAEAIRGGFGVVEEPISWNF
jgi:hypothetical protein